MVKTQIEFRYHNVFDRAKQILDEAKIKYHARPGAVIEIDSAVEEAFAKTLASYSIHSEFTTPQGLVPDYFIIDNE